MKKIFVMLACASLFSACHSDRDSNPAVKQEAKQFNAAMVSILKGSWRSPENKARDQYRHPEQTLSFFGIKRTDTVIEITPSGGWYTEILAPLLKENGHYIAVLNDASKLPSERSQKFYAAQNTSLKMLIARNAATFGSPSLIEIDPAAPELGAANSVDAVLTFRNVHNWVMAGQENDMFEAIFEVLKPGGVLGVVDHRTKGEPDLEKMKASGYLPEGYVINLAIKSGFVLEARSEINANAKDTTDYPDGVWTLPPTLSEKDKDRAKYLAIGESNRMTLRFRKPL